MPHRVDTARAQHLVADVVDAGPLRAHALESGAVAVLTTTDATRDGAPVIGGVSVVPWGAGAIFRTAGERIRIAWDPRSQLIAARAGHECRLCLGGFDVAKGERARACACGVALHAGCFELVVTCQECGRDTRGDAT